MRTHPPSVTLIEPQNAEHWRVVERETTRNGFKAGETYKVAENLDRQRARRLFEYIKNREGQAVL